MKKELRIMAILMAAAVTLSAFSGCSGKKATNTATNETTKTATPENKQYTIKVFTTRVSPDVNSEVMQKIQTKLGQKFEITAVADGDYASKLNLYIASSDMPDVYQASGNNDAMKASATLTEKELETYMPGTYKSFTDRAKNNNYDKASVLSTWSVDGKLKAFSNGSIGNFTPYGIVVNNTLLNDIGISSIPKTISDWDAAFKAYKAKYPNKYPITGKAKDAFSQSFYMFYAAYGLTYSGWQLVDKKLVYGPFMPAWKDALTQIANWYKAGYINPEWFTMDSQAYTNEFVNGNTFTFQYWGTGNQIDPPYDQGTVLANAVAKNANAKFTWCPIPTWKTGVKPIVTNYSLFGTSSVSFGGALEKDKDKLHTVMSTWDKLFNDKEIFMLMRYGIEGTHYDLVNNKPVTKQLYSTQDAKAKAGFGWPTTAALDMSDEIDNSLKPNYVKENVKKLITDPNGILGKNTVDYGYNRVTGTLVTDAGDNLNTKNTTYETQWKTLFTAIVVGQKPISEYDTFIAEWKKAVGNDMTTLANNKYLKQWINN